MNSRQVIVLIFTVLVFGTFERTLAGDYCYQWNPYNGYSYSTFCKDGCCYSYSTYDTCCTTTTTEQPEVVSVGAIIGSTVGGILFTILFVSVLLCVYYRYTEKNRIKPDQSINEHPESTTPQAEPQHAPPSHLPPLPQTHGPSHGPARPSYDFYDEQPHQQVTPPTYRQQPDQPKATPPTYGQQPVHSRATPPTYGKQPVQPIVIPPSNDQQPGVTPITDQPDPKYRPHLAYAWYQFDQNGQPTVDIGTPSSNQLYQPPRVRYPTNQHDGARPNTPAHPPTIHHVAYDPINQRDTIPNTSAPSTQMDENDAAAAAYDDNVRVM